MAAVVHSYAHPKPSKAYYTPYLAGKVRPSMRSHPTVWLYTVAPVFQEKAGMC